MKRIITTDEKEKKDRRNKVVIGIILIGLMVFSTAAYAFFGNAGTGSENRIKYNNHIFQLGGDGSWYGSIGSYNSKTLYNPKDVENFSSNVSVKPADYSGVTVYYSYDSDISAVQEIFNNLPGIARVQPACLVGENCEGEWVVKDCYDDHIFSVKAGNETLFRKQGSCIFIEAKNEDLMKATDSFIFESLGL